jgi:hypothetical protein
MKNIYEAIHKIQQTVRGVEKNARNPAFGSRYANLESVLEAVMPAILENGCILIFEPLPSEARDVLAMKGRIIHVESGEEVSGTVTMPIAQLTPQGWGSVLSYAKRYITLALLALKTDDDDDGNAASAPAARPAAAARPAPGAPPQRTAGPAPQQRPASGAGLPPGRR